MSIVSIIGDAIGKVTGLVDDLHTSDEEKLQAKIALQTIQSAAVENALSYEQALVHEQGETIRTEMTGHSWLQRNWRPIVFLAFAAVIVYAAVFVSIFGLPPVDMSQVPDKMWTFLTVGVGGGVVGRSAEKVAVGYFSSMKSKEEA